MPGLAVIMIWSSGCEEKKDAFSINNTVISRTESMPVLDKIAYDLASDRSWMSENIVQKLENDRFNIPVIKDTQTELSKNGESTEYVVVVERDERHSPALSKSLNGGAYRVALDPDQFYFPINIEEENLDKMPVIEIPTYYYDGTGSNPVAETISFSPDVLLNEPIYFVTLKEKTGESLSKTAVTPGTYVSYVGSYLRRKTDAGNEEFQMMFSDGPHVINEPFTNTDLFRMFNGNSYADAAGQTRTYPDINNIAWYAAQQTITLRRISGNDVPTAFRFIGIEDDSYEGQYNRADGTSSTVAISYYDMADGILKPDLNSKFIYPLKIGEPDDRYQSSGVMSVNLTNLSNRLSGGPFINTSDNSSYDVNWRLTSENIQ